jgi:hypothetical protein
MVEIPKDLVDAVAPSLTAVDVDMLRSLVAH